MDTLSQIDNTCLLRVLQSALGAVHRLGAGKLKNLLRCIQGKNLSIKV